MFKFIKISPKLVYFKEFSCDDNWAKVRFLKRSVTPQDFRQCTAGKFVKADFAASSLPFSEVPSVNEANRKEYLEKKIIRKDYNNNEEVTDEYFSFLK